MLIGRVPGTPALLEAVLAFLLGLREVGRTGYTRQFCECLNGLQIVAGRGTVFAKKLRVGRAGHAAFPFARSVWRWLSRQERNAGVVRKLASVRLRSCYNSSYFKIMDGHRRSTKTPESAHNGVPQIAPDSWRQRDVGPALSHYSARGWGRSTAMSRAARLLTAVRCFVRVGALDAWNRREVLVNRSNLPVCHAAK